MIIYGETEGELLKKVKKTLNQPAHIYTACGGDCYISIGRENGKMHDEYKIKIGYLSEGQIDHYEPIYFIEILAIRIEKKRSVNDCILDSLNRRDGGKKTRCLNI